MWAARPRRAFTCLLYTSPSGLSTKDFVAPSSLCFGTAKTIGLGGKYGAVSFLQILAPELSDEMLADFLKTDVYKRQTLENPTQENPTLENPMQLNKDKLITEKQKKEGLNTDSIPIHSPNPLPLDEDETVAPLPERTGSRKEAAYQIYRDLILENIEYDTLIQNPRIDREQLDEIVDILLETVCTSRKSIRVAGDDYPAELVKAKFLKLDSHHIEFVMDCLRDNTTKVRNIKQRCV